MAEEYLWNREGPPDPETELLERLLEPLALSKPRRVDRSRLWAGAVLTVLLVGAAFLLRKPAEESVWTVAGKPGRVHAGQVIESGAARVELQADSVGRIDIEPDSRMRISASGPERQVLDLQYGTMHALIWAPPARFAVDTPSARSVDLGCSYTLTTGRDGRGLLTVETGWVAFQTASAESFIPAGAMCRTRPHLGPGTPYFQDASGIFRNAIDDFDETGNRDALQTALIAARPRDSLSLWHLLSRASASRGPIYDRFALLTKLPPSVTRDGIVQANAQMLEQTWDALDLGNTEWWRTWKQNWPKK